MPIYEITKDKLEKILEECISSEKIKPTDVELVKEITETIEKLDKIIERKGGYGHNDWQANGSYGRNQDRDSMGRYMDSNNGYNGSSYGRYYHDNGHYGHDKRELISGIEEKMAHVGGEEQETLRRAVRILERG